MNSTGKAIAGSLALALLVLSVQLVRKSSESRDQSRRIDTLYARAKSWEQAGQRSRYQLDSLRTVLSYRLNGLALSPIPQLYVDRLRQLGLVDPVANLVADLEQHPEIIPYPGWHGAMAFHNGDRIRVLGDAWVYAPFDDGHIGGEAILKYEVAAGGKISWRLVQARMVE